MSGIETKVVSPSSDDICGTLFVDQNNPSISVADGMKSFVGSIPCEFHVQGVSLKVSTVSSDELQALVRAMQDHEVELKARRAEVEHVSKEIHKFVLASEEDEDNFDPEEFKRLVSMNGSHKKRKTRISLSFCIYIYIC